MKKIVLFVLPLVLLLSACAEVKTYTLKTPSITQHIYKPDTLEYTDELTQRLNTLRLFFQGYRSLEEFSTPDEQYCAVLEACINASEQSSDKYNGAVSKESLQYTVDTLMCSNIKQDPERFENERKTKWAYYDKEVGYYFGAMSFVPYFVPVILDYQNNTAEVVFLEKDIEDQFYSLDGEVISDFNGIYDKTIEDHLLNDATRYLVEFDNKGRIKSLKKK